MAGGLGYRVPFSTRMAKVVLSPDGCCHWQGTILKNGYGQIGSGGRHWLAHRFFYTELVGEIPEGKVLDHKCHNESDCVGGDACPHRRCVNPSHLEPTTRKINTNRGRSANGLKTHCPQGHEYTETNTFTSSRGHRLCRACGRAKTQRRKNQPGYRELDARRHREARARKEHHARISE